MSRRHPCLRAALASTAFALATACASEVERESRSPAALAAPAPAARPDASKQEIPLPATNGWNASLVYDNGATGIWTLATVKAYPQFGCPEIAGLDDKGHCWILWSYSGKWTPVPTIEDGEWLDAIAEVDLDPRRPRAEIYVGGKRGNLYQIQVHERGGIDCNVVARFPGQEIHWFSAGDLRPDRPGDELLVHTLHGEVYELVAGPSGFETKLLADVGARVRQSVLLPARAGESPWIAGATRAGEIVALHVEGDRVVRKDLAKEPMGMGRIALRPGSTPESSVVYASRDDGVLLRLEGPANGAGAWKRELVYAGPQGPRGVAAGRFDADPAVETVAVFGYSTRVQLLSRRGNGPWAAADIFTDRDKGHWLAIGEFDGRNTTDEIIASGYGGRIVLLARPPGYGLGAVPTDPGPAPPSAALPSAAAPPPKAADKTQAMPQPPALAPAAVRIGVRGTPGPLERLRPLSYRGGFETKTVAYDTLLRLDERGALVPGLAERWSWSDDRGTLRLELRAGARFHDGSAIDAEAVATHLRRVMRLPEHAWLRGTQLVRTIEPRGTHVLELGLVRPYPLELELVSTNPFAIEAPSSFERDGSFARLVGSGALRVLGAGAREADIAYELADGSGLRIDLARVQDAERDAAVDAVLRGELDAIVDNEHPLVPRRRLAELRADPRVRVDAGPGSCVLYLAFALRSGPTADRELRRRIGAALDRTRLVDAAELGAATPCSALFAPCSASWPAARPTPPQRAIDESQRLTLLVPTSSDGRTERLAVELARQLEPIGVTLELVRADAAEAGRVMETGGTDLMIDTTYGLPYDPFILLESRFATPLERQAAATVRPWGADPALQASVDRALRAQSVAALGDVYAEIQRLVDSEALVVPLYVPQRLALVRAELPPLPLGVDVHRLDLADWLRAAGALDATAASAPRELKP